MALSSRAILIRLVNVMKLNNCRQSKQNRNGRSDKAEAGDSQENDEAQYKNQKGKAQDFLHTGNRNVPTMTGRSSYPESIVDSLKHRYGQLSALLNSQYRVKKVGASQDVLATYHDSFLFGEVPLTVKVRTAIRTGWIGGLWHFVRTF